MEPRDFDALTRRLGAVGHRRSLLRNVLASAVGIVAVGAARQQAVGGSVATVTIHNRQCDKNYGGDGLYTRCHDNGFGQTLFTFNGKQRRSGYDGNVTYLVPEVGKVRIVQEARVVNKSTSAFVYCREQKSGKILVDKTMTSGAVAFQAARGNEIICDWYNISTANLSYTPPTNTPTATATRTPTRTKTPTKTPTNTPEPALCRTRSCDPSQATTGCEEWSGAICQPTPYGGSTNSGYCNCPVGKKWDSNYLKCVKATKPTATGAAVCDEPHRCSQYAPQRCGTYTDPDNGEVWGGLCARNANKTTWNCIPDSVNYNSFDWCDQDSECPGGVCVLDPYNGPVPQNDLIQCAFSVAS